MRYCYQGHSSRRGHRSIICFLSSLIFVVPGFFCVASESFLPSRLTDQIYPASSISNDEYEVPLQKSDNSNNGSGKQQPLSSSLAVTSLPTLTTRRHAHALLPKDATLTILAFLAGISDYICFHRLQLFVIMQTGNVIHSLSSIVEGRWKEASNSACIVAAYAIGSGIWRILSLSLPSSSAVFAATTLALPLFYWCDAILQQSTSISVPPLVLSLAFGLISSAATTVGGGIISFAYTGHISNAGKYVAERMLLRGKSFKRTPGTSLRMLLGFASGVLASSMYHQSLLRSVNGETHARSTGHVLSQHPFFVLGIAYATVLILGGVDLSASTSASSGEKETVAITRENTNIGLEELISTKLKIRGIGKRRRRGDELDIRVDGWTNIHSGPRSFDDGS